MRVTLHISNLLNKYFNTSQVELDVDTYSDVISACTNLFLPFKKQLYSFNSYEIFTLYNGSRIISANELSFAVSSEKLYIIPTIQGKQEDDYFSYYYSQTFRDIFYGSTVGPSNQEVDSNTLLRRIQESTLFGKNKTMFDLSLRNAGVTEDGDTPGFADTTTSFGPLVLSSSSGQSVPLNFGHVRVSGTIINSYIKRIARNEVDAVSVEEYVS